MARASVILLAIVLAVSDALTPNSYLAQTDKVRIKALFDAAQPFQDLSTAYHAVLGLKLLGEQIPKAAEICKYAQSNVNAKNVESIFFASGLSKALGNCPLTSSTFSAFLNESVVEGASTLNLYHAITSMKNLGISFDSAKISKVLTAARKKDDSALSLGYAFHVASQLSGDVSSFVSWIEDTVVQADEIDGVMLQFEGGLSISAVVVSGIYKLSEHAKKPPPAMDGDKSVKFANYFLSRKQVQVVRAAYHLLDVLNVLSNNKYHIPVSVSLSSQYSVPVTNPSLQVRISNVVGGPLGAVTATIESALKVGSGGASVPVKKPLSPVKGENTLFEYDLAPLKLNRGVYQLTISSSPQKPDARWAGNIGALISIKLVTEVIIENVEVGVGDVDQTIPPQLTKLQQPNKLPNVLEADYHQKLLLKFAIRDKHAGEIMTSHQAFVVLTHKDSGKEVVFVTEPDSANIYRFDLDVQAKSKVFRSLSGSYSMALIIGDAVISNSLIWPLADVELTFREVAVEQLGPTTNFAPKPEIKHIFREPEARPPQAVSKTFTLLSVLPLLILVVFWAKIGVNVSNFNLNLGTIGFHLGLGGIFGLFVIFWVKLTMFETLKYLVLLGIVTFLCGNSMLRKLAQSKKI